MGGSGPEDNHAVTTLVPLEEAIFAKVGPDGWLVDGQVGSSAETSLEDAISEHRT